MSKPSAADPQLADLAAAEEKRLDQTLNLIAAEHHSPICSGGHGLCL